MVRFALLIDVERCNGCNGCVVGCKNWHGIPAGEEGRIRLVDRTVGIFPDVQRWIFPVLCMQCDHPPCVAVCRFGACIQGEGGIIRVDAKKCVGCELCVVACPYGVRVMRENGVPDSCDLCLERIEEGKAPYCVTSCPTQALIFGDLGDPDSEIAKRIKERNAKPLRGKYKTRPRVYYTRADMLDSLYP
ncbi:MAG: 4Fe-4S dicluster domain-containing protein [Deltaproteobacteria bacterium]|nr:4Fe-4S dicluster domain-containing protein [Deltaproteobacteria bacterium]